ncbi:putative peptidoglycan O-acetyltransferase YrhL [Arthrobacter sp. Hiyo4]|nr:putative peptidoglycan O-acetyltransferase YrhL [Arthrobacter sp. Hiyo4]
MVAAAFAGILVASLVFSIDQTATNQAYAYFDTRARLWEFALGSLLAVGLPHLKPGKFLRVVLGWAGLVAMVSCGLLLTVDRAFPGFVALWPTLAAAAIIVAGQSGSRFGVDRFLGWKPLVSLGDNSYALYLWHWPVLVLALAATGVEAPTLIQGAAIIAASVVLAVLTTRFVEKPLREWRWPQVRTWRTAVVVVACCALLAGPVAVLQTSLTAEEAATAAQPRELAPGAALLTRVTPELRRRRAGSFLVPPPWTTTGPESTRPVRERMPPGTLSLKAAGRRSPKANPANGSLCWAIPMPSSIWPPWHPSRKPAAGSWSPC